MKDRKCMGL